jgi:hypothetical protein
MESRVYGSLLERVFTALKIACLHAPPRPPLPGRNRHRSRSFLRILLIEGFHTKNCKRPGNSAGSCKFETASFARRFAKLVHNGEAAREVNLKTSIKLS